MVRQPGTALRAVVISAGRADFQGEGLVPMNALRTIGHVETIPDAQARVLGLHLPGKLVRANVKTAPALRIAKEAGDRHWAFHHAWERLALLHVLPISRGRAANLLRLVYLGEFGELFLRVRLHSAASFGVFRAALASLIAIGPEDPGIGLRHLVAALVEEIHVIDLLEAAAGKTGLMLDQVLQIRLGGNHVVAQDSLVPRPVRARPHGMDARQTAAIAR